jgi:nicotinate phosphoribosyltransferase
MLTLDRYHAQMGEGSARTYFDDIQMSQVPARFYATQRKLLAAPVLGHNRLRESLESGIGASDVEFLHKYNLDAFAASGGIGSISEIRSVKPGTIMFAGQPIVDVYGAFLPAQTLEIAVEHAFDFPMTVASRAMLMKQAAKGRTLMDFSLRRNGDAKHALDVSIFAYLGGFDQTSNGDAAKMYGIPWVGTVAHYWQQMFVGLHGLDSKHFQQIAFERWLDANPQGTALLLDTIDTELGITHAIAACSTPERKRAFKSFRIDSGNLAELANTAMRRFEQAGITGLTPILTGDLDAEHIAKIVEQFDNPDTVFGVGTKLSAEVDRVAGVIYKLCEVRGVPTLKGSNSLEKVTLPGKLQVLRGVNLEGNYVGDITCTDSQEDIKASTSLLFEKGAVEVTSLLETYWQGGQYRQSERAPSVTRNFIQVQLKKFGYLMNYPTRLSPELESLRRSTLEFYTRPLSGVQL